MWRWPVTQILSGVMRGAGDTMTPMWISMITTIVIRVPIAYGLACVAAVPGRAVHLHAGELG